MDAIRRQQASGEYDATIEPLRERLREQPKDPETNYLYGRALVYAGKPSLATFALREAMEDPAWLAPAGLELAFALLGTGDFNEVVEITTRILEQDPENLKALLYRAQAHAHWKAHPEEALRDVDRIFELAPDTLEAYEPRILALLALNRHDEAAASLEEAGRRLAEADVPPTQMAWHCSTTAIFATEAGDTERAREVWDDCLSKYPAEPIAVVTAVHFFDTHGDWARSLEILRAAHEGMPEHRGFRTMLADRLRLMGRPAEGEALLREATDHEDPRIAAIGWSDLAIYRHAMNEHGAAADALARGIERVREVEEPTPQLMFRYADALVAAGQLEQALAVAKDLVPGQQGMIRARVAQERGHHARALELFDEALPLWPNNAFARYYTAIAAEQLGDFDRALEEYRYAIRIDVGGTDARTRAATQLIARGDYTRAYQLLFLQIAESPLDPEGELLGVYLVARIANPKQLQSSLRGIAQRRPQLVPEALARAAQGVTERVGPAAALTLLVGAPGVDYTQTAFAPTLRALVRSADAAGRAQVAEQAVERALAAHPDAAGFLAIRGLQLELSGAATDAVRAAYDEALEADPRNAAALIALGGLEREADPAKALDLFDRAAAADPDDETAPLLAARALRALGRSDEAVERLDAILAEHPYDGEAAAEIVSIHLERDKVTAATLDRARRAAQFGGGAEAYDRLSEILVRLDQPERATRAAERAQLLRERLQARSRVRPDPPEGESPEGASPES